MRAVVQRVLSCVVSVDGRNVSSIGEGLLVYLGIAREDDQASSEYLAEKVLNLRIFRDADGKMNLSVLDVAAEIQVVSQFTLYADARKGRRPSYAAAAPPKHAEPLYRDFVARISSGGVRTAEGEFGSLMDVTYVNHGPVTILLDSEKTF